MTKAVVVAFLVPKPPPSLPRRMPARVVLPAPETHVEIIHPPELIPTPEPGKAQPKPGKRSCSVAGISRLTRPTSATTFSQDPSARGRPRSFDSC